MARRKFQKSSLMVTRSSVLYLPVPGTHPWAQETGRSQHRTKENTSGGPLCDLNQELHLSHFLWFCDLSKSAILFMAECTGHIKESVTNQSSGSKTILCALLNQSFLSTVKGDIYKNKASNGRPAVNSTRFWDWFSNWDTRSFVQPHGHAFKLEAVCTEGLQPPWHHRRKRQQWKVCFPAEPPSCLPETESERHCENRFIISKASTFNK